MRVENAGVVMSISDIDLTTPKLSPWNDGQMDKLKKLLDDI